jgi:hypothetical protein
MKRKKVIALRILGLVFALAGAILAIILYKKGVTIWIIITTIAVGIMSGEMFLFYANKIVQRKG